MILENLFKTLYELYSRGVLQEAYVKTNTVNVVLTSQYGYMEALRHAYSNNSKLIIKMKNSRRYERPIDIKQIYNFSITQRSITIFYNNGKSRVISY